MCVNISKRLVIDGMQVVIYRLISRIYFDKCGEVSPLCHWPELKIYFLLHSIKTTTTILLTVSNYCFCHCYHILLTRIWGHYHVHHSSYCGGSGGALQAPNNVFHTFIHPSQLIPYVNEDFGENNPQYWPKIQVGHYSDNGICQIISSLRSGRTVNRCNFYVRFENHLCGENTLQQ